jgi:hypothetical protein
MTLNDLNRSGPIPFSNFDTSFSIGTAAMNSNSIVLSVGEIDGMIANCPASVPPSGLFARTDSDVSSSST